MRFKPDMSESGSEPVAEGVYNMIVNGEPRCRLSKGDKTKGQPYLIFQLNHTGDVSGPAVFEQVFLSGKQAFRFANIIKALGGDPSKVEVDTVGDPGETDDNTGVDAILLEDGQPWKVAGKSLSVLLTVETDGSGQYAPKNRVKKYLKS